MKKFIRNFTLLCCFMIISGLAVADQVIFIDVAHFSPGDSEFGVEVDGNTWIRVADPDAIGGVAFAGPGDNDRANANPPGAPFLVIKFPTDVLPGEGTADGKTWVPWARMRVQTDANSFFWQISTDKVNWKPADNSLANRWNDDDRNAGGVKGDGLYYWQDHITGNAADGITADIAVGVNYLRVGVRESGPDAPPFIDVTCFRNDGAEPTDVEALGSETAVEPQGKLAVTWAKIKQSQ